MINAKDLPAARALAIAEADVAGGLTNSYASTKLAEGEAIPADLPRPTLAFNNGRYYVVDGVK
jgi:hypothetical protein